MASHCTADSRVFLGGRVDVRRGTATLTVPRDACALAMTRSNGGYVARGTVAGWSCLWRAPYHWLGYVPALLSHPATVRWTPRTRRLEFTLEGDSARALRWLLGEAAPAAPCK